MDIILVVIIYIIACAVIIFPRLFSNKIKVKGKCIKIKESSNIECPVFEMNYNNEVQIICNEYYTSNSNMKIGNNYNLYISKNDLNNFNYKDNKNIYQYTDIFGTIIIVFSTILCISILKFNVKILFGIGLAILGMVFILYNSIKIISLCKKCTWKIRGKVICFNSRREEKYDYENNYTSSYNEYSPVYEFTYNNMNYKVSNAYSRFSYKMLKQENEYKIKINPDNPNMFIDKVFVISKLSVTIYGVLLNILGLFIIMS